MSAQPSSLLTPPSPQEPIPDVAQWVVGATDWLSLTGAAMNIAKIVTGTNPIEWVVNELGGEWQEVAAAGDACTQLGEFCSAFSSALTDGAEAMLGGWHGEAASAARAYFAELADGIGAYASTLDEVSTQYAQLAYGVWSNVQAITALITEVLDYCIIAAIAWAAAAATSWTLVGGAASAAAAAAATYKAGTAWTKAAEVHGYAWTAAQAFTGTLTMLTGAIDEFQQHRLPAGAYDHAGV